jgi:hypothetical protein
MPPALLEIRGAGDSITSDLKADLGIVPQVILGTCVTRCGEHALRDGPDLSFDLGILMVGFGNDGGDLREEPMPWNLALPIRLTLVGSMNDHIQAIRVVGDVFCAKLAIIDVQMTQWSPEVSKALSHPED